MALNLPDFGNVNWQQPHETFQKDRDLQQSIMSKELDNVFKRITNETAREKNRADIEHTKSGTGLNRANTGLVNEQTKYYPRVTESMLRGQGLDQQLKGFDVKAAERNERMMQQIMAMIERGRAAEVGGSQQAGVAPQTKPYVDNNYAQQWAGAPTSYSKYEPPAQDVAQSINKQAPRPDRRPGETVIKPGNPAMKELDDNFLNDPMFRKYMETLFPGSGIKTEDNQTTGEATTTMTLPSGEIRKQVERFKKPQGFTEANVKEFEKNAQELEKANEAIDISDQLGNLVKYNSKDLETVIGPLNAKVPDIGYSKKKQDLIGQTRDLLGKLVVATAKDIKGPYQGAESKLIDTFKPSMHDDFDVFLGKLKSNGMILKNAEHRRSLYGQYLQDGYNATEAAKMAREETSLKALAPQLNAQFSRHRTLVNKEGQIATVPAHMESQIKELEALGFREGRR